MVRRRKQEEEAAALPPAFYDDAPVDLASLPPVAERRELYVAQAISPELQKTLISRGYDIIDVRALPRTDPYEHQRAILAWIQGLSEGSIAANEEKRKMLELEAKAHGLLVNRSISITAKARAAATIDELLEKSAGRLAMKPVSKADVERALKRSLEPGEDTKAPGAKPNIH